MGPHLDTGERNPDWEIPFKHDPATLGIPGNMGQLTLQVILDEIVKSEFPMMRCLLIGKGGNPHFRSLGISVPLGEIRRFIAVS